MQQPVGDKSGREREGRGVSGEGATARAGRGRGRRRYSQAAQRGAGAAHGARPGEHGEPQRDHAGPRAATRDKTKAAATEEGSRARAQRRSRRGSAGPVECRARRAAPCRADSLCAAARAGGRWLLRSRSRREGNGPAGWVGRWEGRGRGWGGGRRTGREGGARGGRPEPAAPGWELGPGRSPGRGRGGPGRGGRRVWDWGSGLGEGSGDPREGPGRPVGAPPPTRARPLARSWGLDTQEWGAPQAARSAGAS